MKPNTGRNIPEGARERKRATLNIVNEELGHSRFSRVNSNFRQGVLVSAYRAKTNGIDQPDGDFYPGEFPPAAAPYANINRAQTINDRVSIALATEYGANIPDGSRETMNRVARHSLENCGVSTPTATRLNAIYHAYNAGAAHRTQSR